MPLLSPGLVAHLSGRILYPRSYGFGGIDFDTVVSESHVSELEISTHPVETGLDITDNLVVRPKSLVVEGIISPNFNNEFIDWGFQGAAQGIAGYILPGVTQSKPKDAWEALLQLQASGERVEVQTGLFLYKNMVLASVSSTQNKETSRLLRFSAVLQEILVVSSERVEVSVTSPVSTSRSETARTNGSTNDRVADKSQQGTQSAAAASESSGSILNSIYEWVVN